VPRRPRLTWSTRAQLAATCAQRHKASGFPLVVLDGFVLDLSAFVAKHPGGAASLTALHGQDASGAFHGGNRSAAHLFAHVAAGCCTSLPA
jgi:cytochrome b involved in lipid metabolism